MGWRRIEIDEDEVHQFAIRYKRRARFLVDESLGVEAARVLCNLGWNAKYACDAGLKGHSDEDVMAYAWREKRILFTHDRDFLDDRRFPANRNPGVVILPGAEGSTATLERELARVVVTIGRHGDAYRGSKIHIRDDGTWSIRYAHSPSGAAGARILKFSRGGQIWELEVEDTRDA